MEQDSRALIKMVQEGLKKYNQFHPGIMNCRFSASGQCDNVHFNKDSEREMKLHYAYVHFKDRFKVDPATGLSQGFTKFKSGSRAICDLCSRNSGDSVFINSDQTGVISHLVIKHDHLREILENSMELLETPAILEDLYNKVSN